VPVAEGKGVALRDVVEVAEAMTHGSRVG
jgi:hypothetical protein